MKVRVFLILAVAAIFGAVLTMADAIDDFVASLNQAWSQSNDTEVLQIINTRLASDANDVLGLSAKMYFHVFAEGNLTDARVLADSFMAAISVSTNAELVSYAQQMRNEVYSIPLGESGPYTAEQESQLRQPTVSFPFIQKCVVVARWVEQ